MHMEALDRSFSTGSHNDAYPLSPEPHHASAVYPDCIQPEYASIPFDEQYFENPECQISSRTPLSSVSSLSSDSHLSSSSQSSCLSESLSSMSISSEGSSQSSLFNNDPSTPPTFSTNYLPSSSSINSKNKNNGSRKTQNRNNSSVSRRSSAPAKESSTATRKDSFVYDVQVDNDNVLLFVPDIDLVKSHLMLAVREEVDVLKDKIGELCERITFLEHENSILKEFASPETLQQLPQAPNRNQQA